MSESAAMCACMSVCLGVGQCYVRLTVQAFTVTLGEHRVGDLFKLSNSK